MSVITVAGESATPKGPNTQGRGLAQRQVNEGRPELRLGGLQRYERARTIVVPQSTPRQTRPRAPDTKLKGVASAGGRATHCGGVSPDRRRRGVTQMQAMGHHRFGGESHAT